MPSKKKTSTKKATATKAKATGRKERRADDSTLNKDDLKETGKNLLAPTHPLAKLVTMMQGKARGKNKDAWDNASEDVRATVISLIEEIQADVASSKPVLKWGATRERAKTALEAITGKKGKKGKETATEAKEESTEALTDTQIIVAIQTALGKAKDISTLDKLKTDADLSKYIADVRAVKVQEERGEKVKELMTLLGVDKTKAEEIYDNATNEEDNAK